MLYVTSSTSLAVVLDPSEALCSSARRLQLRLTNDNCGYVEDLIAIEHRDFPSHWPRIGGMDFGWDHPFAAVELVWDRDTDVVYVSRTHRLKEATPILHAAAIKPWGNLLWAWPRDGRRETLEGAGIALANSTAPRA